MADPHLNQLRVLQRQQRQQNRKLMDPIQDISDPDNSDVDEEDLPLRRTETRQAKPGFIHGVEPDPWGHVRREDIRLGYRETVADGNSNPTELWYEAGNAVLEMARVLAQHPQQQQQQQQQLPPLRFVKILGAGGLGFVALLDARVERQGRPWDVNLYVCKGVLRRTVISSQRVDAYALDKLRAYRADVVDLMQEKGHQDALAGSLHVLQSYNRAYRRQIQRHRLNQVSGRAARLINRGHRIGIWNNRNNHVRPWNIWRGIKVGISSMTERGVRAAAQALAATRQAAAQQAGPQQPAAPAPAPPPPPVAPAPQLPAQPYDQTTGPPVEHDSRGFDAMEAQPPEGIILMEYLPKGDLQSFVAKLNVANNGQREMPPNRVLWRIWHCFIHMLHAMERPCKSRREQDGTDPYGPLELERHVPLPPTRNVIHFDIDPRNILIGSFDTTGILPNHLPAIPNNPNHVARDPPGPIPPENPIPNQGREDCHFEIPALKLADFGLAKSWTPDSNEGIFRKENYTREKMIWGTRNEGKAMYATPEQFTEEWDWVNLWPVPRRKRTERQIKLWRRKPYYERKRRLRYTDEWRETPVDTAGLYSWKTNLYQFALTMFVIITGTRPPITPIANQITKYHTDDNNRTTQRSCYTYGGYLLDDDALPTVDRELRETLALCLAHKPGDRPEYDELTAQVERKLAYYQAVSDSSTLLFLQGPPRPFTDWAANLPNHSPPSERAHPRWQHIRDWSERRFPSAPPPRLISRVDYDRWLNGIVHKQQEQWVMGPRLAPHPYPTLLRSQRDVLPLNLQALQHGPDPVLRHVWYPGDYEYTVDIRTLPRV